MKKTFKYTVQLTVDSEKSELSPTEFKDIVSSVNKIGLLKDYIEEGVRDDGYYNDNLRDLDASACVKIEIKKVK